GRRTRLAMLTQEAHEYFERRTAHAVGAGMHDGLVVELELVVAQRALQPLQPMNLAAVPRARLLARRVDMDVQAALLFRHVARGIRRIHDVFDGAAAAADLHEADA